jgi:hypothetical protein
MLVIRWITLTLVSVALAVGASINLTPGSVIALQTGFPSGAIQQYSRTGTAGPTLALPVLGDIPESVTVLDGQIFVGDGSGRVSSIDPATGAATTVFNTPNVALSSLGNYNGTLLALNAFGLPPNFAPSDMVNDYSTAGTLLGTITLQSVPSTVQWNGITSDGSIIYIANYASGRIYRYSASGTTLGFFDTGLGAGLTGVSFDLSNNSIWMSDSNTDQVFDFTTTGVLLSDFATDIQPFGLAVIPQSATVPEPSFGPFIIAGIPLLGLALGLNTYQAGHVRH